MKHARRLHSNSQARGRLVHCSLHVRSRAGCSFLMLAGHQEHGHTAKRRRIEAQPATPLLPGMHVRPASADGMCPGTSSGQPALTNGDAELAQENLPQNCSSSDGSTDGSGSDDNEESPLLQRGKVTASCGIAIDQTDYSSIRHRPVEWGAPFMPAAAPFPYGTIQHVQGFAPIELPKPCSCRP